MKTKVQWVASTERILATAFGFQYPPLSSFFHLGTQTGLTIGTCRRFACVS